MPEDTSDRTVEGAAQSAVDALRAAGLRIATAESCTAGLLAATLAAAEGAGDVLHCGYIVYTKDAKAALLGVPRPLMETRSGAVSEAVARSMAENALARSGASLAVAVTGVVGPAPDEDGNPVGRVDLACAGAGVTLYRRCEWPVQERSKLCRATLLAALAMIGTAVTDRADAVSADGPPL